MLKYDKFNIFQLFVAFEMVVLNNLYVRKRFPVSYLYAKFQLPAHTTIGCHKVNIYHLYTLTFISYNIVFHTTNW